MNLKSWLRRAPPPAVIVLDGGKRLAIGEGPRRWQDAADTIESLGATRLEALSNDGTVLRATSLEGDESPGELAAKAPAPGTSDLAIFARLLSEAYVTGATATKASYELAFTENTKLVALLASRLGALEVAWQKSMAGTANLQAALAQASAGGDGEGGVGELLAMMMGGGGAKLAVNGKAKPT